LKGREFVGSKKAESVPKICWHFMQGRCTFGSQCKFIHDIKEITRIQEEKRQKKAKAAKSSGTA